MNEAEKALVVELSRNPVFASLCRELETHKPPLQWKAGKDAAQWAHDTGYGKGIDFVLKTLGYDNGR